MTGEHVIVVGVELEYQESGMYFIEIRLAFRTAIAFHIKPIKPLK